MSTWVVGCITCSMLLSESVVLGKIVPILDGPFEQVVSTESNWLEGPAYDGAGGVWFSDLFGRPVMEANPTRLMRYDIASRIVEVKSENESTNGLAFNADGRLFAAHRFGKKVTRRSVDDLRDITVVADSWNDKPLSQPNDLVIDSKGGIYFTDPDDGFFSSAVYYLSPFGSVERVDSGRLFTNGIALSPDNDTLYVAESGANRIWAHDVKDDGTLTNSRTFFERRSRINGRPFVPDGMTVDRFGNLFVADVALSSQVDEPGLPGSMIRVFDTFGEEVLAFRPPEGAINLTFGPPGENDLYFVSQSSLYRVPIAFVPEPPSNILVALSSISVAGFVLSRGKKGRTPPPRGSLYVVRRRGSVGGDEMRRSADLVSRVAH